MEFKIAYFFHFLNYLLDAGFTKINKGKYYVKVPLNFTHRSNLAPIVIYQFQNVILGQSKPWILKLIDQSELVDLKSAQIYIMCNFCTICIHITKWVTWISNLTDFLFTTHLLDQLQMQQSKTSQDQGTYIGNVYHNKQSQVYCKEALHNIKIDAFAICICILQYMVNNTVAKI